jgi:hypothetical protein
VTGNTITARMRGLRLKATPWVDTSDRLVQAVVRAQGAGHGGLDISATVDVSDYGAPVTITVPPPA